MDNTPLVSIILPTYNVKPYLAKCIDSIIRQTYNNIQIIVVIDGATDGSYEIAREYADKDSRVEVIWQENAGSGPARNNGLQHANGEFVIFVDPDDWVDADMVQILVDTQQKEKVDLIMSGYKTFYENETKEATCTDYKYEKKQSQKEVRRNYIKYLSKGLVGAPTRKLYKMSIIKKYEIEFPDLRRSQDVVFNYRYYDCIGSACLIENVFYHYRIDEQEYYLKLKRDYYRTISLIYNSIVEMCDGWDVGYTEKDYIEFCNHLFPSVISNIEANKQRKESINDIIEDVTIQEIVQRSNPPRIDQKLFKYAIESKRYVLINILVAIKKIMKHR